MINTDKSSLLDMHLALTDFASSQLAHASNFQDVMSYYSNIILCMPGNVYWMDRNCITVGCNQNVLNMFNLSSIEEFVGLSFDDLARMGSWKDNQAESFKRDTLEVVQTGKIKPNVEEPPITYADGSTVYFLTTRVPLFNKDNEVIGIVGISTDITYQKIMEKALVVAKENAEVANKAKQQFLYNMRHDIRSPFTGIVGMAELLSTLETDKLKKKYIDTIRDSSECLLEYLNEILDLAQVEDGNIPVLSQLVNLKKVAESCLTIFFPAFEEKGQVTFDMHYSEDIPEHLFTDTFRVKRILINLLGNAVKFTHKGKISLSIGLDSSPTNNPEDILVNLSVSDTGIGIPADKQSAIFEKFERLSPSYEGKYKGSGLGLFVVRSLAQELRGKIQVSSQLGEGSIFSCSIPMRIPTENDLLKFSDNQSKPGQETTSITSYNKGKNKPKVLLVEDEPIVQVVVTALFESLHCDLNIASSGAQALRKLEADDFDLILMDIGLPDMDGYEAAKKAQQLELRKVTAPIIALTAHAKDDVHDKCLSSGMCEVISKPLSRDKAQELLNTYIHSKHH